MLFIYLSLSGMDELIEMFSVMNQLEKGALGLFFELNYFIGVVLSIYISWFSNKYPNPPQAANGNAAHQEKFDQMFKWLKYQYLYIYCSIFISFMVFCVYKNMDNKAAEKLGKKKQNTQ